MLDKCTNVLYKNTNVLYKCTNVLYKCANVLYKCTNVLYKCTNVLSGRFGFSLMISVSVLLDYLLGTSAEVVISSGLVSFARLE